MEPDQDQPIAREPWQRLLRERYDAPPEVTDARIRQAARRALVPRPSRWWLPASLAASVVLAVMLVQWQYGADRAPAYVTESDVAAPMSEAPAVEADIPPPSEAPPPIQLPQYRLPPEPARERESATTAITASEPAREAAPAAPAQTGESRTFGKLDDLKESAAAPRDPEEWYEEIEALRAAGRIGDAEAELDRLEAAWPGWLAKHHPQQR